MPDLFDLYVGTYNNRGSEGIYRLRFDARSGELGQPELAAAARHATFLALHPTKAVLYAVSEVGEFAGEPSGGLLAFRVGPTAQLTPLGEQIAHGAGTCHVSVDPSGRVVLAANYNGGSVASFPVQEDGHLGAAATVMQHTGSSVHPQRQTKAHAHSISVHPDGRFVVAADLGVDQLMLYRLDPQHATLTPQDPPFVTTRPGAGPRHLVFHPSGRFAYVINELDSTLAAYAIEARSPFLREVQAVSTLPPGDQVAKNTTAEVQMHPSGRFVYGSNRGHDSIAVYAIAPDTGELSLVQHVATRGKRPRHFGVEPGGRWIVAANQETDTLAVFRIERSSGELEAVGEPVAVPCPVCVVYHAVG